MALNILVFIGIFFILAAIGALIGALIVKSTQHNVQPGEIVRTTFTGSPAVLTTALYGPKGEYWNSLTYGYYDAWAQDAVNSLHCDMPGGYGTYSTWLSNGGQVPVGLGAKFGSNTTVYFTNQQCSTTADCNSSRFSTTIPCGTGYSAGGGLRVWDTSPNANYYAGQCPRGSPGNPGTWCSVCSENPLWPTNPTTIQGLTDNQVNEYCKDIPPGRIGSCMGLNTKIPYFCAFSQPQFLGGGTGITKQCAAFTQEGTNDAPIYGQLVSCSLINNVSNSTGVGNICNPSNPQYNPSWWLCSSSGNWSCQQGQICAANWNPDETGFCINENTCGSLISKTVSGFVCSGTVLPQVVLQTTWIAEGKVVSREANSGNLEVLWDRVQNTYPGIGPSLGFAYPGTYSEETQRYQNSWSGQAALDLNWKYSDCRFMTYPGSITSRNTSVSWALLGRESQSCNTLSGGTVQCGSVTIDPEGLNVFNDPLYDVDVKQLLAVSVLGYCPPPYASAYIGQNYNQLNKSGTVSNSPQTGYFHTAYQGYSKTINGVQVPQYNGFPCIPLNQNAVTSANTFPRAVNSAWNLQAHDVNPLQLIRSYFHVIFPFTVTEKALVQFSQSRFLRKTNQLELFGVELNE
jgi:hypothetical protein